MKKPIIPYAAFYLTNVCNFNCPGCNRFNNYNFTGSYQWSDLEEIYGEWAQRVDIKSFGLVGGEPTTNQDYLDWWRGLSSLWPEASSMLVTNGTLLKSQGHELYRFLKNHPMAEVRVSLHNEVRLDELLDFFQSLLTAPITIQRLPENFLQIPDFSKNFINSYNHIKDVSWPVCNEVADWFNLPEHIQKECVGQFGLSPELLADTIRSYQLKDKLGVRILLQKENYFHQSTIIPNVSQQTFSLHHSDPEKAHDICHSKFCHHFVDGKLYKCGIVAVLKDFDNQFNIELTDEDRTLLYSYQPATVSFDSQQLAKFVSDLDKKIPQCKFCPEEYVHHKLHAVTGQKVIFKKK